MSQELVNAIVEMREEEALALTRKLLEEGTSPYAILDDCAAAMETVGQRFEEGQAFIPELILAGEMLTGITDLIKPLMEAEVEGAGKLGTVVIGTVEGDIHDIAKDIVAFMLDINGFEVIDLGVDVPPAKFVESARSSGAGVVALSGFLTLAYDPMKATVEALRADGSSQVKVMIGGGQIDEHICVYTGADAWGRDAMAAVNLAKQWCG